MNWRKPHRHKIALNDLCPCHSGKKYKKCCRPYHNGQAAPTTEALLRSRYSAYALRNIEYLMATTHPKSPLSEQGETKYRNSLAFFAGNARFLGLDVQTVSDNYIIYRTELAQYDLLTKTWGKPEFTTRHSLFQQFDNRWYYLRDEAPGGEFAPPHTK